MKHPHRGLATRYLMVLALAAGGAAQAVPLRPVNDAQIVQKLDTRGPERAELRRLQQKLAQQPLHAASALRLASLWLQAARSQGDARFAGRALAVLQPFGEAPPADIAVLRATVQQHLHAFEPAAQLLLKTLRRDTAQPQAWLLLASVRRTQGRLGDSDAACAGLRQTGAALHAAACALENESLRDPQMPLGRWQALRASAASDAATQAWLWQSQAEHAARAGDASSAETAFKAALALHDEAYTRCALADVYQAQGRHAEALALLLPLPASDAVAVRRALHAKALQHPQAAAWAAELRGRFAQARERAAADPKEPVSHLREQAQFALWVQGQAPEALRLARANLQQQREPLDLLLLAQAGAPAEARQLAAKWELRDARLDLL